MNRKRCLSLSQFQRKKRWNLAGENGQEENEASEGKGLSFLMISLFSGKLFSLWGKFLEDLGLEKENDKSHIEKKDLRKRKQSCFKRVTVSF
jgi:hypothetical protein